MVPCWRVFEMPFELLIILFVFCAQTITWEGFHLGIWAPRMVGTRKALILIQEVSCGSEISKEAVVGCPFAAVMFF